MENFDIIVVGGGMVGLTFARAIAKANLKVLVVNDVKPDYSKISRVSAINNASYLLLKDLDVWPNINPKPYSYTDMKVWFEDNIGKVHFNADESAQDELGFIVENDALCRALSSPLPNLTIKFDTILDINISTKEASLTFANNDKACATLVIATDGANSWVRKYFNVPLITRDYEQTALVANIHTSEPVNHTAMQIFLKEGPLAALPLGDNKISIVWSTTAMQARTLLTLNENEFNKQLSSAFNMHLGICTLESERSIYPLKMRFARDLAKNRLLFIGDSAHTIHPLAGQGVNLGLKDVKASVEKIVSLYNKGLDIGHYEYLRPLERELKTKAFEYIAGMEALRLILDGGNPIQKSIQTLGFNITNKSKLLKNFFINRAMR